MWNIHSLYVFMVVFRVGEQVQTISWPVIFYLRQTDYEVVKCTYSCYIFFNFILLLIIYSLLNMFLIISVHCDISTRKEATNFPSLGSINSV